MINQEDDSVLYLWDKRTLYIGDLREVVTLTPATATLFVGLEGNFEFWTPSSGNVCTAVALIPAGETLGIDHGNQRIACSHFDPVSNDYQLLRHDMDKRAGSILYDSSRSEGIRRCCVEICKNRLSAETASQKFLGDVFRSPPMETGVAKHFQAIRKAIAIIHSRPADNLSNEALAELVGLSSSQLQRQFKAVIGVPVRRYRLWYRLFVTAAFMGYGLSLTDASLEAGFSDASHFNHAFKSMLGFKPSQILKRKDRMRILLGDRCRKKVEGRLPLPAGMI